MPERRKPQAGDRLTPDLWLIAAAMCAGAVVLLFALLQLDRTPDAVPGWVRVGGQTAARTILAAILGALGTIIVVIFSVTLLVLSMAVGAFGPRLFRRFLQDRWAQYALGLIHGSFLYALLALIAVSRAPPGFVPHLTVSVGVLLLLLCFVALVLSGYRVALAIQVGNVLARVADDLVHTIRAQAAPEGSRPAAAEPDGTAPASALAKRCIEMGSAVPAPSSGYVQAIERDALVAAAAREGAVVRLSFRPGHFVATGALLAHVWPAERQPALAKVILDAITIGWNRDLRQDPELGIAQLVEIALRALSPASNDTFTAIACIDWLSESVATFASIPEPDGALRDGAGKIRVIAPTLRFERVAKAAFDQVRQVAVGNVAITIRLLQAFERLGPLLASDAQRAAIRAQAEAIREAVARGGLARSDTADVVSAHARAKQALEPRQAA
jgi:uncharacterized membrane protein